MNKTTLLSILSSGLLLTACGGGGSASAPKVSSTYLLKGTVPGTLIEAYCDNGSTYATNSVKNGTKKHPFSLKLPKSTPCRVVMITNETSLSEKVVTPIKFIDQQGTSSIAVKGNGDIDVGHIDLSLSRASMTADGNNDGVEDIPKEVIVDDKDIQIITKNNDPMDKDHDGIINIYEDDDGDRISNHDDLDDDNDGILDVADNDRNNDGINDNDLDGDGIKNGADVDDDNDGINDDKDNDDDNDGVNDDRDNDDDNDGINDRDDRDTQNHTDTNNDSQNHSNDQDANNNDQTRNDDHANDTDSGNESNDDQSGTHQENETNNDDH